LPNAFNHTCVAASPQRSRTSVGTILLPLASLAWQNDPVQKMLKVKAVFFFASESPHVKLQYTKSLCNDDEMPEPWPPFRLFLML